MQIWLELSHRRNGSKVMVNMTNVRHMSDNDYEDPSKGTVVYFELSDYLIVRETMEEIHRRLAAAVNSPLPLGVKA